MTCKNGEHCDFQSRLHRPVKLSKDSLRYAQLWEQIDLPKLLKGDKP